MTAFLVNGSPAQSVDLADRGFLYGDGVFRTIRVLAGRPLNWVRHARLLARDCSCVQIDCPDENALLDDIRRVAPGDRVVKVIVTRGASGRGYAYAENLQPNRIVVAYPAVPAAPEAARNGVRVCRCDLTLATQPRLAGVKSLNRLENVLARAEWRDPSIREGLLADADGRLVEGTMSNVFLVMAGRLATPALTRCGVAGAQRERVLDLAKAAGIDCEVRDLGFDALEAAEEVFLTNSLIGLWPVVAFRERRWAPGPVTRSLQQLVEQEDARG